SECKTFGHLPVSADRALKAIIIPGLHRSLETWVEQGNSICPSPPDYFQNSAPIHRDFCPLWITSDATVFADTKPTLRITKYCGLQQFGDDGYAFARVHNRDWPLDSRRRIRARVVNAKDGADRC